MAQVVITLDDELLRGAAQALATSGRVDETVDRALRYVIEQHRREAVDLFRRLDFDLSAANLEGAWR